jgi:hypothetical protein
MGNGRCLNYYKTASLPNFDGSTGAKSLFIKPGWAVAGLQATLSPNGTNAADQRAVARLSLQYWIGSVPDGAGGWTIGGGSWTTFWSEVLTCSNAGTGVLTIGLLTFVGGLTYLEFEPPMEIPGRFQSSIKTENAHAAKGGLVPPNTHNASEVAGEWDIRAIWTTISATTASLFDVDTNVQMLTAETT